MGAARDEEADRIERLIASNEHTANALQRLVQLLERKEQKRAVKAPRVRSVPTRKAAVSDRAEAAAKAAVARILGK